MRLITTGSKVKLNVSDFADHYKEEYGKKVGYVKNIVIIDHLIFAEILLSDGKVEIYDVDILEPVLDT